VRPLGLTGVPTTVMARPRDPVRYSRYVSGALEWFDAWHDPEGLVDALERFARGQDDKPVLYYQEDRDLVFVSRWRERLEQSFRFVIPSAELVEDVVDKTRFQALAREHDLPVPRSVSLEPDSGPDIGLAFPIVVKPVSRGRDPWAAVDPAAKAMRVESQAELEHAWPVVTASALRLIAQEYVPGPECRIESYHVYVHGSGERIAEFTGRKIRTWPAEFGTSTAVEIVSLPSVVEVGRAVTEAIGLTGVAKLDFKRGPDGRLHLLEINPRFNMWHLPGAVAGVNLPALTYADLTGGERPPIASEPAHVRWADVRRDRRARSQSLVAWLRWVAKCEARSIGWRDDPLPVVAAIASRVRRAA
jgi:D-aspartate ligase